MPRFSAFLSRLRRPLVLGASAVVTAAALGVGGAAPEPAPVEAVPRRASPAPVPVFVPSDLSIPAIGLETAPVVPVGTEPDGAMGTPKTAVDVAWHALTKPGAGNALFAAHRDWKKQPGSFYRLSDLKQGDEVVVRGEGKSLTFRVTWVEQMDGDVEATKILGDQGGPVVTLITCGGVFDRSVRHYQDRVVARAVLAA